MSNCSPKVRTIKCAECGEMTPATKVGKLFCSPAHKLAFHNRQMTRGKVSNPLLQAMRTRGASVKGHEEARTWAFREMCVLADAWNAEDKAAGRMSAIDYAEAKMKTGWSAAEILV